VIARGLDPGSALDTIPEIDPRAVSPYARAAALAVVRQMGWANESCTRYFVWQSASYVQVLGACPFGGGGGAEAPHDRILKVAPNGLLTAADRVWYIELCPAQRDSAGRPLSLEGRACRVLENTPPSGRR
ncbi:MAG TPA: hypothetical protein VF832_17150, partial [Longimicrobiales bacterium]